METKSEELPDWLLPYFIGGEENVKNIERFRNKLIFISHASEEELKYAHLMVNRNIVSSIGGFIRSIVTTNSDGNYFVYNDEISAYEVLNDNRSRKIEEDYWRKVKMRDGRIMYDYYKIIALEQIVLDEKRAQFLRK